MASTTHLATPDDDWRHTPGPTALPLWNESWWFPFYDPRSAIGVVFRAGIHAVQGTANLFLFVTQGTTIVHSVVEHGAAVPPLEDRRLTLSGLTIDWERPLERFRLRYAAGPTAFDVVWEATSPAYAYPHPPGMGYDQIPGHIEQGGLVTGEVTLRGRRHDVDGLGHRDHTWGGERDWAKFHRWNYLSGEFGRDFWFNAVRIDLGPDADLRIGGLWDGRELLALSEIGIDVDTADDGARQTGVRARLVDERGREHRIVGEEVVVNCPVLFGRTWLKDGITRYRYGDREGWGILEHGYVERR
jgi:hypothetical protein